MPKKINAKDALIEIQTEELPPKPLKRLGESFLNEVLTRLQKAQLTFEGADAFITPRRLAIIIKRLLGQQEDNEVQRKGPAIAAAFDKEGKPSPACIGFARSCGVDPSKLTTMKTPQGEFVGFMQKVVGKTVQELLPSIIQESLQALPIPKRMRWGSESVEFVRPVHGVVVLYGDDIVEGTILGKEISRETVGHRFLSKKPLSIRNPSEYVKKLENSFVVADFDKRKKQIVHMTEALIKKQFGEKARAVISDELLDEVTGIVEWPEALLGNFDARFLEVPSEALISAMQDHQRYFPIVDSNGKLLPHFITISNIASKDSKRVIEGNERVLRARLSDAAFFYDVDRKQKLVERVEKLKGVVFQAKLGTLYDKTERLKHLSKFIAEQLALNVEQAQRAGLLAKTDLTTELVGEFPELQGIAGYHYALHDGEVEAVAIALDEQYKPRFSGDTIPATKQGCVLALADRLDTLVGIFGINQQPTGDKDPFGLRRAALGVLRILIEHELDLDLQALIKKTIHAYADNQLQNKNVESEVLNFILERLKPWYQEQGINPDVFAAVSALSVTKPYDFHKRINAVQRFKQLPDAESLSVANKRVSNILAKYESKIDALEIDPKLFELDAERELSQRLNMLSNGVNDVSQGAQYIDVLTRLADLRKPVDDFFDHVMVMSEDKAQRENRLLLLSKLRALFLQVADVALLQTRSQ